MQYRPLGNTSLNVSVVAMGCWAIAGGPTWGSQDQGDAVAAIGASLDAGVTFFDTAAGYGESESILRKGLGARRDQAVIATKVSGGQVAPEALVASCERSLRALGTDRIDLYQIHWPGREVPLADTVAAMLRLRDQGKVRHIGVSNFGPRDLADLAATGAPCATNQVVYSLLARAIEFEVVPRCAAEGIGILAYSPLAQGLLTGKFRSADEVSEGRARTRHFSSKRPQAKHGEAGHEAETFAAIDRVRAICARREIPMGEAALAWCLHQPGVSAVLAGARNPAQAHANAAAGDRTLDAATLAELDAATVDLKQLLGPSPDLWMPAERARSR